MVAWHLEGDDKGRYADGTWRQRGLAIEHGNWFGLAWRWKAGSGTPMTKVNKPRIGLDGWGGFEGGFNRLRCRHVTT
ncbi:hypothetical protein O9992_05220 [Vibrio lentus]|nr:hypothetical protein [Vibrio lentus]